MTEQLLLPVLNTPAAPAEAPRTHAAKLWLPKRVVFTPDALDEPFGQQILARVRAHDLEVELLKSNRLSGLRGLDARDTYRRAKSTLAVVKAPPGALRLQPTPPSADWQMNLAEGCPAHCQYCYLAGSLSGPPVVKVFANLPALLQNTSQYEQPGRLTSCIVPGRDGVFSGQDFRTQLWDKYSTAAPAQRRQYGALSNTARKAYKA